MKLSPPAIVKSTSARRMFSSVAPKFSVARFYLAPEEQATLIQRPTIWESAA